MHRIFFLLQNMDSVSGSTKKTLRSTGRVSMGVRGMNLSDNDEIIGMQMSSQGKDMLIVSEKGMGKRTSMEEFTKQNRGGKGVKCYKITEKNRK